MQRERDERQQWCEEMIYVWQSWAHRRKAYPENNKSQYSSDKVDTAMITDIPSAQLMTTDVQKCNKSIFIACFLVVLKFSIQNMCEIVEIWNEKLGLTTIIFKANQKFKIMRACYELEIQI